MPRTGQATVQIDLHYPFLDGDLGVVGRHFSGFLVALPTMPARRDRLLPGATARPASVRYFWSFRPSTLMIAALASSKAERASSSWSYSRVALLLGCAAAVSVLIPRSVGRLTARMSVPRGESIR